MEIVVSLLLGIIIGSAVTYYVLQKINLRKTVREYETQIQVLKEQHQQALKDARNRSLDGSRAVIKGKIAEQLAPVLPNFKYLPSDARFRLFGSCYAMDGSYKGWNPYRERHLAIFVNCFLSRAN